MDKVERIQIDDFATERQVEPLRELANSISEVSILRGRLVTVDVNTNEENVIKHGLGRPYLGYFIVRSEITGNSINLIDNPNHSRRDREIRMTPMSKTSETKTISLWVF
jgi:hypothetical protein